MVGFNLFLLELVGRVGTRPTPTTESYLMGDWTMYRYKNMALLLLVGIMLSIATSCFTDSSRESKKVVKLTGPNTSNLPLVIIDSFGQWIPDEPKIPARMRIIYDKSGGRNALNSRQTHFDGKIGIEIRGKTSKQYPKRQYGFEIQDDKGNGRDVSLLGLPAESDWILHGPYSDKTLMRNFLAYEFSNRIGRYATRAKFAEVFLNSRGDAAIEKRHCIGVYLLMEKIKRGKNRVNIQALNPTQDRPREITGGYIVKIDKMDRYDKSFYTDYDTQLIHVYPKGNQISNAQKAWIQNYMSAFESALLEKNFKDRKHEYAKYIDTDAFIDHFIINELFRNIDGFRYSTYMYKDRNAKLKMGPVWDFNISMGNANYNSGSRPDGWVIYTNHVPFWWNRLLSDENFKRQLVKRWGELRRDELSTANIIGTIDQTVEYLAEAQKRNFEKWPVLGRGVWPNPRPYPRTYSAEVAHLKAWLETRLKWIDRNIESLPNR